MNDSCKMGNVLRLDPCFGCEVDKEYVENLHPVIRFEESLQQMSGILEDLETLSSRHVCSRSKICSIAHTIHCLV